MTGKLSLPDLLAKQRQLKKMTVHLRHYILQDNSWKGNCLTAAEVIQTAYTGTVVSRKKRPKIHPNSNLCVMLYAWMDRYYPRVRDGTSKGQPLYTGSSGGKPSNIVWKVR